METQRLKYYRQPLLANPPAPAGLPEGMLLLAERPIKHVPLNLHLNWKPTGQSVSSYMCKLGCSLEVVKFWQKATFGPLSLCLYLCPCPSLCAVSTILCQPRTNFINAALEEQAQHCTRGHWENQRACA